MTDFVLRGGTLVFPDKAPEKKDVLVKGGKIHSLLAPGAAAPGVAEQSAAGLHVFPGLIDCHVHFGMGEKITEYSTETANAAQGGFTTVLGYFLNNEAYGDVFRRELEHARRARPRRLRLPLQHRQRAAHQGARRVRARLRRHLVQVLHELQGRGRALPRAGRHRRRLLLRPAQGVRARRAADRGLPHREHRDRQPRAAQDPGGGRQHAQGLVGVQAARSPSPSRRCAPCTSPRSSARACTSRTSPRARRST